MNTFASHNNLQRVKKGTGLSPWCTEEQTEAQSNVKLAQISTERNWGSQDLNPGSLPTTHMTSITIVCTFPELHSILVPQGEEKKTRQLFFNNSSRFGFWILCCSHHCPQVSDFSLTFSLLPSLTLLSSCISSLDSHLASGVDSLQVQSLFSSFLHFCGKSHTSIWLQHLLLFRWPSQSVFTLNCLLNSKSKFSAVSLHFSA